MAHKSPEDNLAESAHFSSLLIIDEILNNIIASSSSSLSSTDPMDFDAADYATGQLIPVCNEDKGTDAGKIVDAAQGMPVTKKVTFSEDVTVVSYELAPADQEQYCNTGLAMMENEQGKEAFQICEIKSGVLAGSSNDVGDVFREKGALCDADGSLLKRKWIGNDLEDGCIIHVKVMKPEVDSLLGHQDLNGAKASESYCHDYKNKAKLEANKIGEEADLKLSESQDTTVASHENEAEHEGTQTAKHVASTSVCCPSDQDCKVQDNLLAHSLCQDEDDDTDLKDTLSNNLLSSDADIISDCRSVLQMIVENTLCQMVLNIKSAENSNNTSDAEGRQPYKKMKLAPPSDTDNHEDFFPNSTVPDFRSKKEIEPSPNPVPQLAYTSTADVEQLCFSETTDIKVCSIEAGSLCDILSLNLPSERESENGSRALQGISDSTSVSTSNPDVKEDEDVDRSLVMRAAEISLHPGNPSNVRENDNLTSNDDKLVKEVGPYLSTLHVDVEVVGNIQDITPRGESNASSLLALDLYLENSVEGSDSEPSEVFMLGMQDEECVGGNSVPSSADVELVKSDDVYVDAIEPSLREDIMPSQGSSSDDFSYTFQKASQVLTSSQDETSCSHHLRKIDGLSPADLDLEMNNEDLQLPDFVSMEPIREEMVPDAFVGDWGATLSSPDKDDTMSKVPEICRLDHLDFTQEPLDNLQCGESKGKETALEFPEHQFLQVLGLSAKQNMCKSEEQRKPCGSRPNKALPALKMDSSGKDSVENEENELCILLVNPFNGNLENSPIKESKVKSISNMERDKELSRVDMKLNNDQTVPSLQTPVKDNSSFDQLLELEESIFTEQDHLEGPSKQSIPVVKELPLIADGGDEPIPDHLQTLGLHAAGVFQWNHSRLEPSLTPSLAQDQSTFHYRADRLDHTPPITPVRPLPVCQRRRRVGLSRRQLVYPLHARTSSRK